MAYFPQYMVPGICVYPSGREPLLSVQEYFQPDGRVGSDRDVARRGVEFYRVGRLLRRDPCAGKIYMGRFPGAPARSGEAHLYSHPGARGMGVLLQPKPGLLAAVSGCNGRRRSGDRGFGRRIPPLYALALVCPGSARLLIARAAAAERSAEDDPE